MKNRLKYIGMLICSLLALNYSSRVLAQNNTADITRQLIENRQFTFVATSVSPLRGNTKYLNEMYDVRVTGNTLVSSLPYFGVAQTPAGATESGIKFTSSNFDYSFKQGNKNNFDIQVVFKDQAGTRQFHFLVFDNGNATLDVTSNFRDPISFSGYLKK